jgi:hypothetical protein
MKTFCAEKKTSAKGNIEITTWASENSQVALDHKT